MSIGTIFNNICCIFAGYTALHWAAYNDEVNIAQLICDKSSAIQSMKSRNGATALHVAAASNSLRTVRYLLQLAPCRALIDASNDWGETSMHVAAAANNIGVVEELLRAGANCQSCDKWHRTPYMVRASSSLAIHNMIG